MTQKHKCAVCGRNDVKLYRWYAMFLRDEDIRCKAHVDDPALLENQNMVPLVEDKDGSVWGYTSAPDEDIFRFFDLPDNE